MSVVEGDFCSSGGVVVVVVVVVVPPFAPFLTFFFFTTTKSIRLKVFVGPLPLELTMVGADGEMSTMPPLEIHWLHTGHSPFDPIES